MIKHKQRSQWEARLIWVLTPVETNVINETLNKYDNYHVNLNKDVIKYWTKNKLN